MAESIKLQKRSISQLRMPESSFPRAAAEWIGEVEDAACEHFSGTVLDSKIVTGPRTSPYGRRKSTRRRKSLDRVSDCLDENTGTANSVANMKPHEMLSVTTDRRADNFLDMSVQDAILGNRGVEVHQAGVQARNKNERNIVQLRATQRHVSKARVTED